MTPTAAALEKKTATVKDDAGCRESTAAGSTETHIDHQAYACWDSEETRHFYEDILEMPLIATVVIDDPLHDYGAGYCYTFFEIGDGTTLAFFEHMSLVHPKYFNARSARHRHIAFELEGDASVQRFKRKLDAAGVANTLTNPGTSLSLRFNDPNGLVLECTAGVRHSLGYDRPTRSCPHSALRGWLLRRQNWWRGRPLHENSA